MTESAATADALRDLQPVQYFPGDKAPEEGIGLCLSGGGYRAMLYHLGALWRLNELALLGQLKRVSSVSGGSITAATLGLNWHRLEWHDGIATNLEKCLVTPVRALARETIDMSSVIEGLLPFTSIGKRVAHAYREHLFAAATLQELPDDAAGEGPRFVLCATNLESGVLFRFSRPYLADYRVGTIDSPDVELADAVAASSAFPPMLSPFELDLRGQPWRTVAGNDLFEDRWRGEIKLSDGGVYDNLGLETVWKRYKTVLISDGGGHVADDVDPSSNWPQQVERVLMVVDNQVRSLRKRQAIGSYKLGLRTGAYWGIRADVKDYDLADPLESDPDLTRTLAQLPTRLKKVGDERQEQLINWGYVICDTALRRWVACDETKPDEVPYPNSAIG